MSLPREAEWTDPGSMDPPPRVRGRRILMALALLFLAASGSVAIWHAASLRRLPDIGEPFDERALGSFAIPDEENAFTYYRAASAKLAGQASSKSWLSWGQVPPADKEWFFANAEAIELWLEGTTRDRAVYHQPKDIRIDSRFDVAQDLRRFAQLGQIAGLRMEGVGDLDQAWAWYRAGLRSSRHVGTHGGFIERLNGIAIYSRFADSIRGWAGQPNLTTDALRQALDEVIAINAMTPSLGDNLRSEYFALEALLEDTTPAGRDLMRAVLAGPNPPDRPGLVSRLGESLGRFLLREPERSRRLLRLVYANWLAAADLPDADRVRRMRKGRYGPHYDPTPGAPKSASLLTATQQDSWIHSTLYLRMLLSNLEGVEKAEARETALRASLVIRLAEELYVREHGKAPETHEQLVGPYLQALPPGYVPPEAPSKPAKAPR